MKKIIQVLVLVLGIFAYSVNVFAQSGTTGPLTWKISNDTLYINGSGAMPNYDNYYPYYAPWYSYRAQITQLIIGDSVTTIGNYAFYNCNKFTGSLIISDSVTYIGSAAFQGCNAFRGLIIGDSVKTIGGGAFGNCSSLDTVNFNAINCTYMGNNSNTVFQGCTSLKTLNIGNQVKTIPDYAFKNCSSLIGNLIIPDSVTTIGEHAFHGCNGFTGLTIGNSVTTIGKEAFGDCYGFTGNLTIPNSVTSIWSFAFAGCYNFKGTLTIPNSVTTIGNGAFYSCIGFSGNLIIPNSVTFIGDDAFMNCSGFDGNLTIPNSVTTIRSGAFYRCTGFTGSLIIPNSVTYIGNEAFENCKNLTSLTIPNSVIYIGEKAFRDCNALTSITVDAVTPPTLWNDVFNNVPKTIPVYVPCGSILNYQNYQTPYSNGWNSFSNYQDTLQLQTPNNLTVVQQNATLKLNWQNIGAANYEIYRNGILLDTTTITTYTDSVITIGTNYCYQIKALNGIICTSQLSVAVCKTFLSTDATLANLTVSTGTLTPTFIDTIYNYVVNVAYNIDTMLIVAMPNYPNASVLGDGLKQLLVGANPVTIIVIAEDGATKLNYNIIVTRAAASTNAYLSNLTVSAGTLTFNSNLYNYFVPVAYSVDTITINATASDAKAAVSGTGIKQLAIGMNQFTIIVIAEDGLTTANYTLMIIRSSPSTDASLSNLTVSAGTLTPAFNNTILNYSVNVANSINTISITATANHPNATVIGDGSKALNVGANPFTITVTAEDGTTQQNYIVTINRDPNSDASLSNLTVSAGTLTPAFNSSTYNYTVNVANSINTILITATANHQNATVSGDGSKTLNVGANPFTITVTAEDGTTTQNYIVTVHRDSATTPTLATISGFVLDSTSMPVSGGTVKLYKQQSVSQYSLEASEAMQSDGSYEFTNVAAGDYIIKAEAQLPSNYLDTWHLNSEFWNLATILNVTTNPLQNIDIILVPATAMNGNSSISGFVSNGTGGQKSLSTTKSSNPAENVTVYLQCEQNALWKTVSQQYTNSDGYYIFANVPAGTYRVILDIPGLGMIDPQIIELNDDENIELEDYIITEGGIYSDDLTSIDNYQLGIDNYDFIVYPNPNDGNFTIDLQNITNAESLQIIDIVGTIISEIHIDNISKRSFSMNLASGSYFVRVICKDKSLMKPIVISK